MTGGPSSPRNKKCGFCQTASFTALRFRLITMHEIPWFGLLVRAPLTSQSHEKLKRDFLHDLQVAAPKASRVLAPKAVMIFFLIDAGSRATQ